MFAGDTSKRAGSEARGEGRERGNLLETAAKPPDTQRAGGIHIYIYIIYIYEHICKFGGSVHGFRLAGLRVLGFRFSIPSSPTVVGTVFDTILK